MGKGSKQRPTDKDKFDNNYDRIFGKKKKEQDELREKATEPNQR
jgi:hypothetical protein